MKFLENYKLEGDIKLISGLHIGGNKDKIEIGGVDNPVIKDPITGLPYIPGSSIKGKMRFLLEWAEGRVDPLKGGEPCNCGHKDCPACRIFGNTSKERDYGPTRLVVNDCPLVFSEEQKIEYEKGKLNFLEEKIENSINRLSGTANPRRMERVPAGLRFGFSLTYKIFKIDGEPEGENVDEKFWSYVLTALYLLQEDTLGGSGSRGYGRIKFENLKFYKGDTPQNGEFEIGRQGNTIKLIPKQSGE